MRTILTILFTFTTSLGFGQSFNYPSVPGMAPGIDSFIPQGWTILDSAYGDLNKDKQADAALVLQLKDSVPMINNGNDTVFCKPRILLILFRQPANNGYTLAEQNNTFILMNSELYWEDPYQQCSIENGVLSIHIAFMGTGMTSIQYAFRYQQGQFTLIGAEKYYRNRMDAAFENDSYNFLTGKLTSTKGNEQKQTAATTRRTLNVKPLKTFKTFKAPYTWEISKYVFL